MQDFKINEMKKGFFIHSSSYVDENVTIGSNTNVWHFSHLMSNSVIGENCNIGQNVVVSPDVILGNNVKVQNNVSIYTGVVCEDNVFLGPSMVFTNIINPRSSVSRRDQFQSTLIKKGATIGANATIVCGNTIGKYAFVGAGCVVTKNIPDYALVVGNPSRQIGWVSEFGNKLDFDKNSTAKCKESDQLYRLESDKLIRIK